MDLVWEDKSILLAAQQHISDLLHGSASRMVIIWRQDNCDSLFDWTIKYPDRAREFRRALRLVSAAIYRRHEEVLQSQWSSITI
eukprot:8464082-Pyramimonas_sp.AAC.1